jgi:LysR family transcriptional activator of nhaA
MNISRLNFKHLRYFAAVAAEGSVLGAARRLHVAPQTVSAQLRMLEEALGRQLFERAGRRLVLTVDGEVAQDYAKAIFALGEELTGVLGGGVQAKRLPLRLGITDSVPKLLVARVLEPVLARHRDRVELTCQEGPLVRLLGRTAAREIDGVLADLPAPPDLAAAVATRELMNPGLTFLAAPSLAASLREPFPKCLDGAPFIHWPQDAHIGQAIDMWFSRQGVQPRLAGRFDDSALMKTFATLGLGLVAVPSPIEKTVARRYRLVPVGRTREVRQPLYLIRPKRQRPHPLVTEIEQAFTGRAPG